MASNDKWMQDVIEGLFNIIRGLILILIRLIKYAFILIVMFVSWIIGRFKKDKTNNAKNDTNMNYQSNNSTVADTASNDIPKEAVASEDTESAESASV